MYRLSIKVNRIVQLFTPISRYDLS